MFFKKKLLIVSGLPRSGTSLMMRVLYESGYDVLFDDKRESDASNPHGYFELEEVKKLVSLSSKADKRKIIKSWCNRGWIKLTSNYFLKVSKPKNVKVFVIYMTRSIEEIIASQNKMSQRSGDVEEYQLLTDLRELSLKQCSIISDKFVTVDFYEMINNPDSVRNKIRLSLGVDLNAIQQCVDPNLYRNRQ